MILSAFSGHQKVLDKMVGRGLFAITVLKHHFGFGIVFAGPLNKKYLSQAQQTLSGQVLNGVLDVL